MKFLVLFSFISQTKYFTSLNTTYINQVVDVTALNILLSISGDSSFSKLLVTHLCICQDMGLQFSFLVLLC